MYNGYGVSFPRRILPECGVVHMLPSSVAVKARVELYLYSPSGRSWTVKGEITLCYFAG
jgi:hypothetical protein